jgi:peroxiredoxin
MALLLGDLAPDFEAMTTDGKIKFHDWIGDDWVIFFSHPADYTPVCTTEFMGFQAIAEELEKRNVALLGNSVDSVHSHIAWVRNIKDNFDVDISFPIIADLDLKVSTKFGMIHEASADTSPVRKRCSRARLPSSQSHHSPFGPSRIPRSLATIGPSERSRASTEPIRPGWSAAHARSDLQRG